MTFFKIANIVFKIDGGCFFVCCFYLIFILKPFDRVPHTSKKTQKSKQEVKKRLEESLINDVNHENKDIKEKGGKVEK